MMTPVERPGGRVEPHAATVLDTGRGGGDGETGRGRAGFLAVGVGGDAGLVGAGADAGAEAVVAGDGTAEARGGLVLAGSGAFCDVAGPESAVAVGETSEEGALTAERESPTAMPTPSTAMTPTAIQSQRPPPAD